MNVGRTVVITPGQNGLNESRNIQMKRMRIIYLLAFELSKANQKKNILCDVYYNL